MNKFLTIFLTLGFLFALFTNDKLVSSFLETYTDQLERNEYFRILSAKYYGTRKFGKELSLINQKIKIDENLSESDLIIPKKDAIIRIYENYDKSLADEILQLQQNEKPDSTRIKHKPFESSMFSSFVGIIIVISLAIGYMIGRRRI